MPQALASDEELMASYQDGSREAFEQLYLRHSGKVLGYLRSRCGQEQLAQDLFQEVFVKLHKSKHLYKTELPALPWLFSITHSVLIDGQRKTQRQKEVLGEDIESLQDEVTQEIKTEPQDMTSWLDQLPAQQKQAVQMRFVEEKTFEDIAQHLGTTPMNVRQIVSRGVKHLKKLIQSGGH